MSDHGHVWQSHLTLPVSACKCGALLSQLTGRVLTDRADKDGYRIVSFGRRSNKFTKKVHRLVMEVFAGSDQREVDHKDRDRSHNSFENLRYLDTESNRRNVGVRKHSSSGIRNVRFIAGRGKYQAYCRRDGKFKHLAYVDTAQEAQQIAEAHYGT